MVPPRPQRERERDCMRETRDKEDEEQDKEWMLRRQSTRRKKDVEYMAGRRW